MIGMGPVNLSEGKRLLKEYKKQRDLNTIDGHNADIVWRERWVNWASKNGEALINEVEQLEVDLAEVLNCVRCQGAAGLYCEACR